MRDYEILAHTRWDCKYHVAFIPKKRRKLIYGKLRRHLGEAFYELAKHKGVKIVEGHLMPDHIHMCISIPPKHSVSNVVGYPTSRLKVQLPSLDSSKVVREISMASSSGREVASL